MTLTRRVSSCLHAKPSWRHRPAGTSSPTTYTAERHITQFSYEDQDYYLNTLQADTFDWHLLKQDPAGRIRYLNPVDNDTWFANRHRRIDQRVQAFFPGSTYETHLLPFWTVCHLGSFNILFYERLSGKTKPGLTDFVDVGYSVAAVDKDHWCSGLVLMDDLSTILNSLLNSNPSFDYDANRSARIFCELPFPILASAEYDPAITSPFKIGYPRLGLRDFQTIMRMCTERDMRPHEMEIMRPIIDVKGEVQTFAIPTYRIAYKVTLPDGRLAYLDGSQHSRRAHAIHLPPGGIRMCLPTDQKVPDVQCMRYHSRFTWENHPDRTSAIDSLADNEEMRATLYNCIQNSITPLHWMDHSILPAVVAFGPTAYNAGLYSTLWLEGGTNVESGRPKYNSPLIREYLRNEAAARSDMEASALADQPVARISLLRAAQPKKTLPEAAPSKSRTQSQPKKTPRPLPTKKFGGPPPKRPLPSHFISASPQVPLTAPIRDPLKAYQTLNVDANGMFLDQKWEDQINTKLKDSWLTLSRMYSLDYGIGAGPKTLASEVNMSYDQVKTLQLRLRYDEMRDE